MSKEGVNLAHHFTHFRGRCWHSPSLFPTPLSLNSPLPGTAPATDTMATRPIVTGTAITCTNTLPTIATASPRAVAAPAAL